MRRAVLMLMLGFTAFACGGGAPAAGRGGRDADGSYTYIDASPAFTLDPARVSWEQDIRLCNALFDGLVRWDPSTFEIVPGAAERWEVSADGKVYTFHFREGAAWSNGDALTAQDFVYSWRRMLMPDTAADYTQAFFAIRGGAEFFRSRGAALEEYARRPIAERTNDAARAALDEAFRRFEATVGVRATDDRTLEVTLERPHPYFLELCAFVPAFAVHPPTVEAFVTLDSATGRLRQEHGWTKAGRLVSSGAYTLERWRFKRDMLLEKSPRYWNAGAVRAPRVTVLVIEDANTRALAFETGAADWATDVHVEYLPDMLAAARGSEAPTLHGFSRFGTYFWSFNCLPTLPDGRANPFRDARVRRAFTMATDRRALVEQVRGVGEEVAETLIPPGTIPGYDPDRSMRGLSFDPEGALRLLAEAGWRREGDGGELKDASGARFPIVEMLCSTGSYHRTVALAMGGMWERALGVRTALAAKETKAFRDDLRRKNYMVARGGWFGDFADPESFLHIHRSDDGNNDRGYANEAMDDLLRRADWERDPAKRLALLEAAERQTTVDDPPLLPLWRYRQFYQFDPRRLHGVSAHPRAMQRLDMIWKSATPEPDPYPGAPERAGAQGVGGPR